nr:hypothetical protein [Microbispora sp. KK1-11]
MSFEYLADPESGPRWKGTLPGAPEAFFLRRGEGERAMLFTDLFTVLLGGDETDGQFGIFTMDDGPPRCTTRRPRCAGCAHAAASWESTPAGSRSGARDALDRTIAFLRERLHA